MEQGKNLAQSGTRGYRTESRSYPKGLEPDTRRLLVAQEQAYYKELLDKVDASQLNTFSFDVHQMTESGKHDHLVPLIASMFIELGFVNEFQVSMEVLFQFILAVKRKYRNVLYHNFIHAFDVTQTVYAMIHQGKLQKYLRKIDLFVLLVAALCHDMDHMGLNNQFHSKAETPLGLLYNASGSGSVLEVHHCSLSIAILSDSRYNVFNSLSQVDQKASWMLLISAILATDMAKHNEILGKFSQIIPSYDIDNLDHRTLLVSIVLKCADISNVTKPFPIARRWAIVLAEEFFAQGDQERKLWSTVSPNMDRSKAALPLMQLGFIQAVALPVFRLYSSMIPHLYCIVQQLESNRLEWNRIMQENLVLTPPVLSPKDGSSEEEKANAEKTVKAAVDKVNKQNQDAAPNSPIKKSSET